MLILGLGRSLGGGNGNPLQYFCLEIPRTEEPGGLQSISSFVAFPNISKLSPSKSSLLPYLFLAPFPPMSSLFMLFLLLKCFHFPLAYHTLSHLAQVHLLQRFLGNGTTLHPSYSYCKIWWVLCSVDLLYSKFGPWGRNSWTPVIHAESHPAPESACQPDARWLQCTSNFEMHCSTTV